ncbi:GTP 3',8-cyclase MoaA [Helicobacter sp. 13S00477-4]|uniref:GTP 3',8-cyclase MoaA n=1 Tax=Helicobacter sp. 13S00477-4 TaxID=1905759 RepID=UPI000BA7DBDF|nr:GTP 3',8-cyclase MoaA [Helicobacter sp. 13S00477-4]PAF52403.1 cyclic pyranopterin phosphate synthase [Helicobacter sp. 13S00477-4]
MLTDTFGRKIDYIRVSLTKQCNFRCQYCMPNTPMESYEDKNDVPLENVLEFLKVAIDEGIKKIRITGGEPLLRKNIDKFIASIHSYAPHIEIALTTNAFLLKKYAASLKNSGLNSVNISLDSLQKDRVVKISKKDALNSILLGIQAAIESGLKIKLNMVPLRGINADEIIPMLDFAKEKSIMLRYIEYMENIHAKDGLVGLREDEILWTIQKKYSLKQIQKEISGPAKIYQTSENQTFGIIAPHNDDFCKSCNRIRLTSEGTICPCLYYQDSISIKEAMLTKDKYKMKKILLQSIINKPEKNNWKEEITSNEISARAFFHTGG